MMASSSTSSTPDSSDDTLNGTKLMRLILDGGTEALRNVFKRVHPVSLQVVLSNYKRILSNLKRRKVLNQTQWDTLYPTPPRLPNINDFDITLLSVLLRNICGLDPPSTGWDNMPNNLDCSVEADVVRIKLLRNDRFAHIPEIAIPADDFKEIWAEITLPLIRLGVDRAEIDRLENEKCGPNETARVLKEKNEFDEKILSTFENMEAKLSKLSIFEENKFQSNRVLDKFLVHFDFKSEIQFYLSKYVSETRQWVLDQVSDWFHDKNSYHRAFVISSPPGMGKSVLAAVICDTFEMNIAYCHFIQYNNSQYKNPNFLLQSLAWHLCQAFPAYKEALVKKLSGNLGQPLNEMNIEGVFSTLFKELLTNIAKPGKRLLIVLDAVDESEYYGRYQLSNLISNHFQKLPAYIRFVITARPEKILLNKFSKFKPLLIDLNDKRNLNDIKLVLQKNLPCVCQPGILTRLAEKCGGLMLYAYFLTQVYQGENFDESQTSLPGGIDEHYETYVQRLEDDLRLLKISNDQFLSFLSVLAVAQEPMPEALVESLFQFDTDLGTKQKVRDTVNSLSSLFLIQEDRSISFFHKSVRDWLVNNDKHRFCIDIKRSHDVLFRLCVAELKNLKQQSVTCDLPTDVALRYALKYCIEHLLQGNVDTQKMECFVTDFVTDLQVMFAGVYFDIDLTVNNLYMLSRHDYFQTVSEGAKFTLNKLILLLRKSGSILHSYPQTFLQIVVNQGGEELSLKASILLQTRYKYSVYLEYFKKHEKRDKYDVRCNLSGILIDVDISPNHDYAVCLYYPCEIELFSLTTGRSEWRISIPSLEPRARDRLLDHSFYCRLVVFHPFEQLILPGKLDEVLAFHGTTTAGPFQVDESVSELTHLCFSTDGKKMATVHMEDFISGLLIVWNVLTSVKEKCFPCRCPTSLSFTASGNYLGVIGLSGEFKIYDLTRDYEVKSGEILHIRNMHKFISSFDQNSWLCCYYDNLEELGDRESKVIVVNSDFSERLVRYSSFIKNVHVPSTARVCNDLQSFIENHDESWFSVATARIRYTFGWPKTAIVSYLLIDEKTLAVFSFNRVTMYIIGLERLDNLKDKVSKKTQGFSAISNNGDFVYLSGNEGKSLSICHVRSENRRLKSFNNVKLLSLIVFRNGLVLFKDDGTLELWNNDLTQHLSSFDELTGAEECLSISDEILACVVSSSIAFFNVITQKIIHHVSCLPDFSTVLACSVRYHVLINIFAQVDLLKNERRVECSHEVLEETLSSDENLSGITAAQFSPDGNKLVIFKKRYRDGILYIFNLDHDTVQFYGQIPIHKEIGGAWLRFFGNEKLVCCRKTMMYLIEVGHVKLLTVLDVDDIPESMSVCQQRQIICLGYESLEKFDLIRICLQR